MLFVCIGYASLDIDALLVYCALSLSKCLSLFLQKTKLRVRADKSDMPDLWLLRSFIYLFFILFFTSTDCILDLGFIMVDSSCLSVILRC